MKEGRMLAFVVTVMARTAVCPSSSSVRLLDCAVHHPAANRAGSAPNLRAAAAILYVLSFAVLFSAFYAVTSGWAEDLLYELRLRTDPRVVPVTTIEGVRRSLGFKNAVACGNSASMRPRLEAWRSWGPGCGGGREGKNYSVVFNAMSAARCPACDGDVTIAVHGNPNYLKYVPALAHGWQGAISMSVLIPDDWDDQMLNQFCHEVYTLQSCTGGYVLQHVSFHFYFEADNDDGPRGRAERWLKVITDFRRLSDSQFISANCSDYPASWVRIASVWPKNRSQRAELAPRRLYPINVGRNIAVTAATTFYVMPSDVKLVPGPLYIQHKLLQLVKTNDENFLAPDGRKMAFVLPIYEVDAKQGDFPVPSKRLLQRNLRERTATRFHIEICKECYSMPFADEWEQGFWPDGSAVENSEKPEIARIHSITERAGQFASWDPVFIAPKADIPEFDERLSWEGKRDRKSVMFQMCARNFSFAVLEEGFLVHQPGIKPAGLPIPEWRREVIRRQSDLIDGEIKSKLLARYPWAAGKCVL